MENESRAAVVLCGGQSTRMGRPKHLLPFGEECLLQRVVGRLLQVVPRVCVVAADGQEVPPLPDGVVTYRDAEPNLGPLSGLATALSALADTVDAVYLGSCDSPFLSPAFVEGLFGRLGRHDLVIVRGEQYVHPLAAVYHTRLAGCVRELVSARRLRPIFLLEECDALVISEDEARQFDPELMSLKNLNTPKAYEEALAMAGLAEASDE